MIETLLPQIQKLVSDKTINSLKKEGPKVVAKSIYNLLPGPIRLVVKEDSFINFCFTHQDKIFGKSVPTKKPTKKSAVKKQAIKRKK